MDRGVPRHLPVDVPLERARRFSIWAGDAAAAAISLTDGEAARLAQFVAPPRPPRRPLGAQIRQSLHL
jgi:hypothetical protein